jgi:hypothetical protein
MRDWNQHIALDILVELARGRLPVAEQPSLQQHLAGCVQCAMQLARIIRLIDVTGTDTMEKVPDHIVNRAKRLMRQRRATAQSAGRRRITATLRFDSAHAAMVPGRRSQQSGTRQLLFHTEQHTIDLRLKPIGVHWIIWGQLLGEAATGRVQLEGPTVVQRELNSLVEFTLPPVPAGSYSLILALADIEIDLGLIIEA